MSGEQQPIKESGYFSTLLKQVLSCVPGFPVLLGRTTPPPSSQYPVVIGGGNVKSLEPQAPVVAGKATDQDKAKTPNDLG